MLGREAQAQKHTRIARRFIDAADHYLVDGDVIQASEKLWGAASHAVKVFLHPAALAPWQILSLTGGNAADG